MQHLLVMLLLILSSTAFSYPGSLLRSSHVQSDTEYFGEISIGTPI